MSKKFLYLLIFPVIGIFNEDNKKINLNLNIDNKIFQIKFNRNQTVIDLKNLIKNYYDIEVGDKIFYKNQKLNFDLRLIDYNIQDNDTIDLVLKKTKRQLNNYSQF